MLKAVSEKDLLRLNPHIDRNKLSESLSLSEQLANNGVKMSEYRLASPSQLEIDAFFRITMFEMVHLLNQPH